MRPLTTLASYQSARCLRALQPPLTAANNLRSLRPFSTPSVPPQSQPQSACKREDELYEQDVREEQEEERGAMSRLLAEMSETALEEGGRGARKAVEEAGFSAELRRALEEKIHGTGAVDSGRQMQRARSLVDMPSSAGKGTKDTAAAAPWTGTESVEDAALRMLTDAHEPMKTPYKIPSPRGSPVRIAPKSKPSSTGSRLANARDRSSVYSILKDGSVSEKEREQMRKQLKERFTPAAREVPATLQGLASLANERIEDAIARGQFKNLPRGKQIERDHNASSPFLDTTEYFMNKIIQKQDIVPAWIEKQQELVSTATKFRSRLRSEWKRHAARLISSRGGTLREQMREADEYAAAEALVNPPRRKEEEINTVDGGGHVSQITLAGELTPSTNAAQTSTELETKITVEAHQADALGAAVPAPDDPTAQLTFSADNSSTYAPPQARPSEEPFRDPKWEAAESSYHALAITNLNNLTRSYNLMAPNLAKKPYFSLDRELRACYADVAPQLAGEIRDRAMRPAARGAEGWGSGNKGLLANFEIGSGGVRIKEDGRRTYGFREFWRDLFRGQREGSG